MSCFPGWHNRSALPQNQAFPDFSDHLSFSVLFIAPPNVGASAHGLAVPPAGRIAGLKLKVGMI